MTTRRKGVYTHLELFDSRDWGLIVYDEVHLLPAPIFRFTADIQSRRRLGLTATLVREDGREGDVFSLIGPKRYDAPWKDIEAQGYIAPADCVEVRVTLTDSRAHRLRDRGAGGSVPARLDHATEEPRGRAARRAAPRRPGAGHRRSTSTSSTSSREHIGAPVIKGETTVNERERLFEAFRRGEVHTLVVSQGGQLLRRPAGGRGGHPGLRDVRVPAGGGAATRPDPAAEVRRPYVRASTPSSRGTPSTRSTPRTGNGSWPSRATPTASSTPTTSSPATRSSFAHLRLASTGSSDTQHAEEGRARGTSRRTGPADPGC